MSDLENSVEYIKQSVTKIIKYFSNTDNNIKILMNKISVLENKVDELVKTDTKNPQGPSPLRKEPLPNMYPSVTTPEAAVNPNPPTSASGPAKLGPIPGSDKSPPKTGAKTVFQKVVLKNGKGVYLADVTVSDDSGNIVKTVRTNPKGRWIASLTPGDYTVYIKKKIDENLKLPIEIRMKVTIPDTDQSDFELDSPDIPDVY